MDESKLETPATWWNRLCEQSVSLSRSSLNWGLYQLCTMGWDFELDDTNYWQHLSHTCPELPCNIGLQCSLHRVPAGKWPCSVVNVLTFTRCHPGHQSNTRGTWGFLWFGQSSALIPNADFDHNRYIFSCKYSPQILLEHRLPFDPAYTVGIGDWQRTWLFRREADDRKGVLVGNCAPDTQSNRKALMSGIPVVLNVSPKEGYSCKTKLPLNSFRAGIHICRMTERP